MFFCGFGLKAALVPFHAWLPDAHPAAPAPISAMLSGIVIKAVGVYVLARLLFNVFGITDDLLLLLRWIGGITMVVGSLLALGQWDIKRLFAYSSISQIGLIVLTLGFGTTLGVVGALYHLVNHAVFKSAAISQQRPGGNCRRHPGSQRNARVGAADTSYRHDLHDWFSFAGGHTTAKRILEQINYCHCRNPGWPFGMGGVGGGDQHCDVGVFIESAKGCVLFQRRFHDDNSV